MSKFPPPKGQTVQCRETENKTKQDQDVATAQSSDLSWTEVLWQDLSRAVHKQMATRFKEVWARMTSQQCERLIKSHRKQLPQSCCC